MPSHIVIPAVFLAALTFASVSCVDGQLEPTLTSTPAPTAAPAVVSTSTPIPLSSPVPMHTPTPESKPTPAPTDAPIATAAGATKACDLMNTPYDTLTTFSSRGEDPGEEWQWRSEIRDSGPDRHMATTIISTDGTLIAKSEDITKHGTRYSRESVSENPETYGEWRIVGTDLSQPFPPPCLDPDTFDASASGTSDEPHLTTETFLSEEEGTVRKEYWADATGRPTRSHWTFFPPEYDSVTNPEMGVMEHTYSDYGEPNIIEAPCASAAPDQSDNPALMRDCIYLLNIRDALRGTTTLNWNLDTPLSRWSGVHVEGSPARVTQLILESRGLSGTLPWELVWLDGLEHLWLADNQLTGEIPAGLGRRLGNLRTLTLSANQLTGEIPTELGRLANLHSLRLGNNQLTGCIPQVLRNTNDHDLDSLALEDCPAPE